MTPEERIAVIWECLEVCRVKKRVRGGQGDYATIQQNVGVERCWYELEALLVHAGGYPDRTRMKRPALTVANDPQPSA